MGRSTSGGGLEDVCGGYHVLLPGGRGPLRVWTRSDKSVRAEWECGGGSGRGRLHRGGQERRRAPLVFVLLNL